MDSSFVDEGASCAVCCCWEAKLAKESDKRTVDAGVKSWNLIVSDWALYAVLVERESSWNILEESGICNVEGILLLQKMPNAEQGNAGCQCG